jgi:hypothetical protein
MRNGFTVVGYLKRPRRIQRTIALHGVVYIENAGCNIEPAGSHSTSIFLSFTRVIGGQLLNVYRQNYFLNKRPTEVAVTNNESQMLISG